MSRPNYKKIEIEVRDMVALGRKNIYQIATRLRTLLNDSASYAQLVGMKPDDVNDHLNGYLRDYAVDLEDICVMLNIFPDEHQWDKPLVDLLRDAEKAITPSQVVDDEKPPRTNNKIKRVEFDAVVKERDESKAESRAARNEMARLIAENDQLKAEVAKLRGQVEELRRMHATPAGK